MALVDAFSTLGLGLVLIHRFCRNINAKLICMSNEGGGTTIQIIHPLKTTIEIVNTKKVVFISEQPISLKNIRLKFNQ